MIKPLNDNVAIIYEEKKEETTASGIIVTGSAVEDKSKPAIAIVAGVGDGVSLDVKVGDVVFWDRIAKGVCEGCIIVHESTLLAVIENETD
jgi:co-chaperonin GroES (HSP10)